MSNYVDLDALWRVAVLSTAFAVGVVALYALGITATTAPEGVRVGRVRRGVGVVCFVVCLAVIIFGIRVMLTK